MRHFVRVIDREDSFFVSVLVTVKCLTTSKYRIMESLPETVLDFAILKTGLLRIEYRSRHLSCRTVHVITLLHFIG